MTPSWQSSLSIIKRVLNYDPDENVRSRAIYQDPERGDEYFGVFNLEYTGNLEEYLYLLFSCI